MVHDRTSTGSAIHTFSFEELDADEMGSAIVTAVARVTDADPMALEDPLYDIVDANQIERVFRSANESSAHGDPHIIFDYHGCSVSVWADRSIVIHEKPLCCIPARPQQSDS